jgi:putative ABC transport system ATP-binding protein
MPLVALDDVVKVYRMGEVEVRALAGVSLSVEAGDFVAIMGASGSGKSTLMNILGCLDRPSSGSYRLAGTDVASLDANARAEIRNARIGFVFQSFNLLSRTSALENVELPLIYGTGAVGSGERLRRSAAALAQVGLEGREHHFPSQLSGGQQQRVAIARALVTDPAILLADEPTGNLDTATSQEVMEVLSKLNAVGKTIILITHESDIAGWARRRVVLRDGRILEDVATAREPGAGGAA